MFSWGRCDYGQLGLGGIPDIEIPSPRTVPELPLEAETEIQDIRASDTHSVIMSSDGKDASSFENIYVLPLAGIEIFLLVG